MYPISYKKKFLDISQKDPIYQAVDALLTLNTVLIHKCLQDQHSVKYFKLQGQKPHDFQILITFQFTTVEFICNIFSINVDRSLHLKKYLKCLSLVKRNMKEFNLWNFTKLNI